MTIKQKIEDHLLPTIVVITVAAGTVVASVMGYLWHASTEIRKSLWPENTAGQV
jgi:hypothetical protein